MGQHHHHHLHHHLPVHDVEGVAVFLIAVVEDEAAGAVAVAAVEDEAEAAGAVEDEVVEDGAVASEEEVDLLASSFHVSFFQCSGIA